MRKIVFISTNEFVPWGGSEFCWVAVAERLARGGAEVRVSVKRWDEPVKEIERLRSLGCRICYRSKPGFLQRVRRRFLLRHDYFWEDMRKVGAGADLAVISQGNTTDGLPWMEAAKAYGIRYAIIVQAVAEQWWPDDKLGQRLATSYEGASAVYFVSQANVALARRQFATSLDQARVIRNPFNVRYDARPLWPEGQLGEMSLACVGRLDAVQKAQDVLVDVLSLPHWRSRNIRLALVGSGTNERSLRRMVEMSKLTNVEFAGFVGNIEKLWSQHHALVLPSRFEGMPLALVEAMLCGRSAIVTDVAGHRELVRDGVNGFLAKAPTVELFDNAMNRAWENRSRLREMGEQAAKDVRQWVSADPVEDLFRELTALATARIT